MSTEDSRLKNFETWLKDEAESRIYKAGLEATPAGERRGSTAVEVARLLGRRNPSTSNANFSQAPNSTAEQKKAMEQIVGSLNKVGITNKFVQMAALGVVNKESKFNPAKPEISYKGTSVGRIREVFGERVAGLSDAEIENLKRDDDAFWERVYGVDCPTSVGRNLGNTSRGDASRYRGRGYHGLTGKANYRKYTDLLGKIGNQFNLVENPEILNTNSQIAADVVALYLLETLNSSTIKSKYGNKDPNDFKNLETAVKAVANAVAGPGNSLTGNPIIAQGYQQALSFAQELDKTGAFSSEQTA